MGTFNNSINLHPDKMITYGLPEVSSYAPKSIKDIQNDPNLNGNLVEVRGRVTCIKAPGLRHSGYVGMVHDDLYSLIFSEDPRAINGDNAELERLIEASRTKSELIIRGELRGNSSNSGIGPVIYTFLVQRTEVPEPISEQ